MSTTSGRGDGTSVKTPEELDRARWAALDDAEATVSAVADALGRCRLDDVRRYADDLAKIAAVIAEPRSKVEAQTSAQRLDRAHDAVRAEPPYDVRRETHWQYTRRLAKAALEAGLEDEVAPVAGGPL